MLRLLCKYRFPIVNDFKMGCKVALMGYVKNLESTSDIQIVPAHLDDPWNYRIFSKLCRLITKKVNPDLAEKIMLGWKTAATVIPRSCKGTFKMHLASTSPPLYHCSSLPLLRQSPDHIPHRARIILCNLYKYRWLKTAFEFHVKGWTQNDLTVEEVKFSMHFVLRFMDIIDKELSVDQQMAMYLKENLFKLDLVEIASAMNKEAKSGKVGLLFAKFKHEEGFAYEIE
ncbi:unnamed protein product [Caenorhabditis auriculariae]|uniref:Uncharacterized protein n=1 Tax=Caenorhabditis auriculariae TaxID=2777116 RepID=A0A8S1HEE7_9PELO|nr:unnamed protein product [Caenorhabditis auriculariae]